MTSASELFYNRRSRLSRPTPDLGFDSSPPRHRSSHHKPSRRHHANHNPHHRRDSDGSDPVAGSSHVSCRRYRVSQLDCESVPFSLAGNQSGSGDRNGTETISRITNQIGFSQNDRLPGPVLLARERLVQRLRGVSLSANRRSYNNHNTGSEPLFINMNDVETEIHTRQPASGQRHFSHATLRREFLVLSQGQSKKKPPGLTEEALNCLKVEEFSCRGKAVEGADPQMSWDCSICLESFKEGDELISLPCEHSFHSACLGPWLRFCGDCPYCRTILVQPGM